MESMSEWQEYEVLRNEVAERVKSAIENYDNDPTSWDSLCLKKFGTEFVESHLDWIFCTKGFAAAETLCAFLY